MPYIGKTPTVGNFQVCDAISVVNGQAAYTLQVGGVNVAPESANHMLVSLNGILQKPGSSFTISGSTMTFASNLATGDVIDFVQILGNVLDFGAPSDDSVATAKLQANSVTGAKLNNDVISAQTELASEPADTDEFLVSDAGTIKRIDYSLIKGGGGLVHIKTQTVSSAVSSVDFVHGTSGVTFDSTYKRYKVIYGNLNVSGAGIRVGLQFRKSSDSSFDTGNNYSWAGTGYEDDADAHTGDSTGDSRISLSPRNHAHSSTQNSMGEFILSEVGNTSRYKGLAGYSGGMGGNGVSEIYICGGSYESTNAVDGFRLIPYSGNIDTVTVTLFGISEG